MPEVISNYGTDKVFYYIANNVCYYIYINPNYITISTIFITNYISYLIIYNKNFSTIMLFVFIRSFFDILDGAMARYYNKTSEFGRLLDSVCDLYYSIIMFLTFFYKYIFALNFYKIFLILFFSYIIIDEAYTEFILINKNNSIDIFKQNKIMLIIHDNYILCNIVFIYCCYYFLHL